MAGFSMVKGAQSLDRALDILQRIAAGSREGVKLSDLLRETELSRASVHRLLASLIEHGIVDHDTVGRRYYLGAKLNLWAMRAMPYFDFREIYAPVMAELVAETGDTVFLNRRVGDEAICLARESGSFPIKAFVLEVGMHRVLGQGAGGIAMLAAMQLSEAEKVLERNRPVLLAADIDLVTIERQVAEAREAGHVIRNIGQLGVRTVAMAIRDSSGRPAASLSVSTIMERMAGAHLHLVMDALTRATARIGADLAQHRPLNPS